MSAWSGELALAFSLAERADAVSMSNFASEDLTTVHKADGTPVAQVDFDTEQAMLDVTSSRASRRCGRRRGGRSAVR